MRFTLVASSHLYPFYVSDCLPLSDASVQFKPSDDVAILLGDRERGIADALLCGREQLQRMNPADRVDVRIYFPVAVSFSAFLSLLKYFRKRNKAFGTGIYHVPPSFLRESKLERCRRTEENAYRLHHLKVDVDSPLSAYQRLSEQLKGGFDDRYPLTVMLHRVKRRIDSLDDGHHRLGLCIKHQLPHVGIKFCYASSSAACANILLWRNILSTPLRGAKGENKPT